MCQGSGLADASDKGTPGSGKKSGRRKDPAVIATKEVVGRHIAVWSDDNMEWSKAAIAQYSPDTCHHLIRFLEREEGSVKHEERWVNLARTRFQWLTGPSPTAAPNPTNQGAPKGEDAVGYQVRVFWPGMGKWYQGKIEAYDSETKQHTVKYRDGDVQKYKLRHEAVVYLDKSANPPKNKDRPSKNGGSGSASKEKDGAKEKDRARNRDGKDSKLASGSKRGRNTVADSSGDDDQSRRVLHKGGSRKDNGRNTTPPKKRKLTTSRAASTTASSEPEDDDEDDDEEGDEEEGDSGEESDELESDEDEIKEESDSEDDKTRVRGRGRPSGQKNRGAPRKKGAGGVPSSGIQRKGSVPPLDGAPRRRGRPPGSGTGRRQGRGRKDLAMPRMLRAEEEIIRSAGAAVVNARVAVFWNDDDNFYKGKLIQFDSYHKRHKIVYDDGEEEWVALTRESFRYLTPRTRSAGCNTTFRTAMAQLGAAQEIGAALRRGNDASSIQGTSAPVGEVAINPPAADESVGWEISIRGAGDGRWHRAEILCYDSHRGRHDILYADGEDEWVTIEEEEVVWHKKLPAGREGLFPGKQPSVEAPVGRGGVGWRVSVFWPGDTAFYPGEITGWDETAGQYEVSYDDGEEGTIKLNEDRVKWILPPGVAVDHENLERMEVGGGRPRRRVTAAGADSDPDYEFEHATGTGFPGSGRGRRGGGPSLGAAYGSRGGRLGRPPTSAMTSLHGWGDSLGGEGSDALPSPLGPVPRGPTPFGVSPGLGGSFPGLPMPAVAEGFVGEPVVHRSITRVPAFAVPSTGVESRLPTAVTVKIYLSGSSSGDTNIAQTPAPGPVGAVATPQAAGVSPAVGGSGVDAPASNGVVIANGSIPDTNGAQAVKHEAVDAQKGPPPATATATATPVAPRPTSPPIAAPLGQQMNQLPPASKLGARLRALELMGRRVGRAQQTIVKGVPTDLPTHVVRPLRVGPPPSMARIMAAGGPGILGPARTPGAPGSHRLSRPGGPSHSPFHRRRSLDEEESEEDEDEERSDDEDGAGEDGGQDGEDGGNGRGDGNAVSSSSGSSDDEGGTASDEGEAVVSPRSPSFPRGGKVKPAAAGAAAAVPGGSGDIVGGAVAGSGVLDRDGNPEAESPMVTGIRPAVPPSPFLHPVPSGGHGSRSAGLDLKELSDMHGGGDLPAVDSVANMLTLPRNHSTGALLGEMQSGSEVPEEGDGDFMQLT